MFTVIIVVCSVKNVMPSFVFIGCCVSELNGAVYVPLVMYGRGYLSRFLILIRIQ